MMERFIRSDLVYILCEHLSPGDIRNLILTYEDPNKNKINKKLRSGYLTSIAKHIDLYFQNLFSKDSSVEEKELTNPRSDYEKFREEMVKCNAFISGSFIIQMALGEYWGSNSDIDIYFKVKTEPLTDSYDRRDYSFVNHKYNFGLKHNSLQKFFHRKADNAIRVSQSQYNDDLGELTVLRVNQYYCRTKKNFLDVFSNFATIETIEINDDVTYQELFDYRVDFKICKNFFRYVCVDGKYSLKLCIKHLDDIITKTTVFNHTQSLYKSLKRCQKYMWRGFKFKKVPNNMIF